MDLTFLLPALDAVLPRPALYVQPRRAWQD